MSRRATIMKTALYGKNAHTLKPLLKTLGYSLVTQNPDLIISYGGDGTLIASERDFPGIAKLPIRDSKTCIKCPLHQEEVLLSDLKKGQIKPLKLHKLEVKFKNQTLRALNDIVIRNSDPSHAVRLSVLINNEPVKPEIVIGDGIVAATPFGSTGYYKSITRKTFLKGFALAFNNPVIPIKPIKLNNKKDKVFIKIVRGPAILSVDNNPKQFSLNKGDTLEIKLSDKIAFIFQSNILRCQKCTLSRELRLSEAKN